MTLRGSLRLGAALAAILHATLAQASLQTVASRSQGLLTKLDLHAAGPNELQSMDLNRDGVLDAEEFQAALGSKHNRHAAMSTVEIHDKADGCKTSTSFNASFTAASAKSAQLFRELRESTMLVMAEQKAEAAALEGLRQLHEQAVEDLKACDAQKSQAVQDIQVYEQELEDIASLANVDKTSALEHSLLARKSVSIQQVDGVTEAAIQVEQGEHVELHQRLSLAAQRLRFCTEQHKKNGLEQGSAERACLTEEQQLARTYDHAHATISAKLRAARALGEDACHMGVIAGFEVSKVALEEEVAASRKRLCAALREGEALETRLSELQTHLQDASTALTGECQDDKWMVFESGMYVLAGLVRSRPHPKAIADTCSQYLQ
mmetsp:Transcript_53835/g.128244  ORF Transcript_53835/g.128244 Transcript_53835/m.128244 type:complete len:378 (-) Transcript_53835:105-1238(-)